MSDDEQIVTYAERWDSETVDYYIDGQLVRRIPRAALRFPYGILEMPTIDDEPEKR